MSADRILITDCDSKTIHLLRQILSLAGYEVIGANKVERAIQMATEERPALIISELNIQSEADGIELIRHLRDFSEIPIIILSANTDTGTILRAFEAGADDFVAKPFEAKILLARIKAILRRCKNILSASEVLTFKDLSINLASRQVSIHGEPVSLTQTEYNLLVELARHSNQVMVHEQLLIAVWGPKYSHEIDYLRSYVHTLRRKLEKTPSQPSLIVSLSGVGYMLSSELLQDPGK